MARICTVSLNLANLLSVPLDYMGLITEIVIFGIDFISGCKRNVTADPQSGAGRMDVKHTGLKQQEMIHCGFSRKL